MSVEGRHPLSPMGFTRVFELIGVCLYYYLTFHLPSIQAPAVVNDIHVGGKSQTLRMIRFRDRVFDSYSSFSTWIMVNSLLV